MAGRVSIRAAAAGDAAAIARVQVETWRTTYRGIVPEAHLAGLKMDQRTLRWRELLQSPAHALVAECQGEVVGFITGGAIREPLEGYRAELYAMYLLLAFQRRGIGTALLEELARRLSAEGFENLAVWVLEANPAVHFYERSGAVRLAAREHEIGGARLPLVGYGWPDLRAIISRAEA